MSPTIRRTVQLLGGLISGLVAMEAAFWLRDDGAFPHVNFYVPDSDLGVRLEPGAQARIQFRENPLTTVRINSLGYRGPEPRAPSPDEILIVGDSQVFGLGVEEDETFSSRLANLVDLTIAREIAREVAREIAREIARERWWMPMRASSSAPANAKTGGGI